jgi:hypothetical protein
VWRSIRAYARELQRVAIIQQSRLRALDDDDTAKHAPLIEGADAEFATLHWWVVSVK